MEIVLNNKKMRKEIRKKIFEAQERKERIIAEQTVIRNRMMTIFEKKENIIHFKKLPIKKQEKIGFAVLSEIAYIQKNSLLCEEFDLWGLLQTIFGSFLGKSTVETLAEPIFNKILTALGFSSQGIMKKTIISFLTTNPQRIIDAFGDCKKMTSLIVDSFSEGVVMMLQEQFSYNSIFYNGIRNMLGGTIKDSEWGKQLDAFIGEKVCSLFNTFTGNAQELVSKLQTPK